MSVLTSPIGGAAVGGGVSALTQVALKLAIKLDGAKPASEQKAKLFLYRHAGLVGLGASLVAAAVYYFGLKKKDAAYGALAAGVAASAPGIIAGIQAAQNQKKLGGESTNTPPGTWNAGMGAAVAQQRGLSGAPQVQVFGSSRSDIQLMGAGDGGGFNSRAFGGGSF